MRNPIEEHAFFGKPGLRVALSATTLDEARPEDAVAVRVEVKDAARPLRVSVYLDGDLVDTWTPSSEAHEIHLANVRGRHVVTARAFDAAGRWGGASVLIGGAAA